MKTLPWAAMGYCFAASISAVLLCGLLYTGWAGYRDFTIMRAEYPMMKAVSDQVRLIFDEQTKQAKAKAEVQK